jgi:GntR family transcriptional regulator
MKYRFSFSQTDKRPLYLQIKEQMSARVAMGDWPPGVALPSIRELAKDLNLSIITIKRAYRELEREGTIITQPGKASRVNDVLDRNELQREALIRYLTQAGELAKSLGVPEDELMEMLKNIMKKD